MDNTELEKKIEKIKELKRLLDHEIEETKPFLKGRYAEFSTILGKVKINRVDHEVVYGNVCNYPCQSTLFDIVGFCTKEEFDKHLIEVWHMGH